MMSTLHPTEYLEGSTRVRILEAALELIVAKQTTRVSLRQIAKQAGLFHGNIHYYFNTKEELFIALLEYILNPILAEREMMMMDQSIEPTQRLDTLFQRNKELISRKNQLRVILDFLLHGEASLPVLNKLQNLYQDWRKDIQSIIQQGIENGVYAPQNLELLAVLIVSLFDGITTQYILDENTVNLDKYFDYTKSLIVNQLLAKDSSR